MKRNTDNSFLNNLRLYLPHWIGKETLLFIVAGSIGFLVDTGVLYALRGALGNYRGRALSFIAAVTTTWLLNRRYAFANSKSELSLKAEFISYCVLMLLGGGINYAVYALLVSSLEIAAKQPVLAVACGSIAGMAMNFITTNKILFKHRQP